MKLRIPDLLRDLAAKDWSGPAGEAVLPDRVHCRRARLLDDAA